VLGFIEEQNEEQGDIDDSLDFVGDEDHDVEKVISLDKQLQMLYNGDPALARHVVAMVRKHAEESNMIKKALSEA